MSDEINIKTKSKKRKLFILLEVLIIAGLTITMVVLWVSKTAMAKKVDKQLSLGEKYLSELEYEQAIVAYEEALKFDPKNTDAYLGLADVYIAMEDYEKAEEILVEAKDVIKKEEDRDRIKQKETKIEENREEDNKPTPTLEPTPTPTSIPTPKSTATPKTTATPTPTKSPSISNVKDLKNASLGDYITFGTYEQDNNLDNGAEPIEWLLLDKEDGKALVLSKYALDVKLYNEEDLFVTWETCILRSWLNDEFYYAAFSKNERSAVVETFVINNDNLEYGSEGGNNTIDKVFLLSIEEVNTYFNPDPYEDDPAKWAKVTEYAKAQGGACSTSEEYHGNGWWWLRSPGFYSNYVVVVDDYGRVHRGGFIVSGINLVVRPAIWIAY